MCVAPNMRRTSNLATVDEAVLDRAGIAFGLVFLLSGAGLVCYAAPENGPVPSVLALLGATVLLEGAAIIAVVVKNWWSCVKAVALVKKRRHGVWLPAICRTGVRPYFLGPLTTTTRLRTNAASRRSMRA